MMFNYLKRRFASVLGKFKRGKKPEGRSADAGRRWRGLRNG